MPLKLSLIHIYGGGHVADLLAVNALDDHAGLRGGLKGNALRLLELHRMGVAPREHQLFALLLGAVTDALQGQGLLEALGLSLIHI